jgi:hypothetical protein
LGRGRRDTALLNRDAAKGREKGKERCNCRVCGRSSDVKIKLQLLELYRFQESA